MQFVPPIGHGSLSFLHFTSSYAYVITKLGIALDLESAEARKSTSSVSTNAMTSEASTSAATAEATPNAGSSSGERGEVASPGKSAVQVSPSQVDDDAASQVSVQAPEDVLRRSLESYELNIRDEKYAACCQCLPTAVSLTYILRIFCDIGSLLVD